MIAYRTTSGRLIDLWSLKAGYLGWASQTAAFIQQRLSRDPLPSQHQLYAEVAHKISQAGLDYESPGDEALAVFILDLLAKWSSLRRGTTIPPGCVEPPWALDLFDRADELGTFVKRPKFEISYAQARQNLAVSRLVRAHLARIHDPGLPVPGWREYRAEHSDLAWTLGADRDEFVVKNIAEDALKLFAVDDLRAPIIVHLLSKELCRNPNGRIAYHLGVNLVMK